MERDVEAFGAGRWALDREVEWEAAALTWAAICRAWGVGSHEGCPYGGTTMEKGETSELAALVYVADKGRVFAALHEAPDVTDVDDGSAYAAAGQALREAIRLYVRVKDGVLHQRLATPHYLHETDQERSGTADE